MWIKKLMSMLKNLIKRNPEPDDENGKPKDPPPKPP